MTRSDVLCLVSDEDEDLVFMYDRRVFLARRDFMDVLDLLSDSPFSCLPMRLIEARLAEARLALEALGGLGGVW